MSKPIDKYFSIAESGKAKCLLCGAEINNQGLAKVFHLTRCNGKAK